MTNDPTPHRRYIRPPRVGGKFYVGLLFAIPASLVLWFGIVLILRITECQHNVTTLLHH